MSVLDRSHEDMIINHLNIYVNRFNPWWVVECPIEMGPIKKLAHT